MIWSSFPNILIIGYLYPSITFYGLAQERRNSIANVFLVLLLLCFRQYLVSDCFTMGHEITMPRAYSSMDTLILKNINLSIPENLSESFLLMSRLLASTGHQKPWFWLHWIMDKWFFTRITCSILASQNYRKCRYFLLRKINSTPQVLHPVCQPTVLQESLYHVWCLLPVLIYRSCYLI